MGVFSGNDVDTAGDAEVTLKTAAGAELLGQQVSAASLPVVIASNQSAVPISAASLPLPTGAATETTLGTVNTNLGIINANLTNGNQVTSVRPSTSTTYSVGISAFTPGATPTDIITITGSATKTIRVLSIEFTSVQTTRALINMFIIKRSAANTGGTSTTPTVVPADSNNAAPTAVVRVYTANPTVGAAVGNLSIVKVLSDDSGANAVGGSGYMWDFTKGGFAQGAILRGTSQVLAVSLNGATLPIGLSVVATVTWTEE